MHEGWTRVAFGDVVRLSRERSSDPIADGFDRYVGLEHLDPGDLEIRRWGNTADGTTFTNVFRPGQVLFGKRRAYQRKVAVADFSGVCSSDIYVLEPRNAHLLHDLVAFVCRSEGFFDHVIRTSAGSLSPRTNWTDLAKYEFILPTIAEQKRVVEALAVAEAAVTALGRAAATQQKLSEGAIQQKLTSCLGYPAARLTTLCSRVGVGIASSATHAYRQEGVPMIRNTNIKRGYLDLSDLLYLDPAFDRANASKRVQEGDVVIARSGLPGAAAVVPDTLDRAQTFTTLVVRPLDGVLDPDFLVLWINSRYGRDFIASMQGGGVLQNMNATLLTQLPVRVPPLSLQRAIADSAAAIESGHKAILGRIDATAELARTVQRKAFGASE